MAENLMHLQTAEKPQNGQPPTRRTIISHHQATGEKLGEVPCASREDVQAVMQRARAAQPAWAARPLKERIQIVREFQHGLYRHYHDLSEIISAEHGKTLWEAGMIDLLPQLELTRYYVRNAKKILKPRRPLVELALHRYHRIEYRPRGVALVISPWNFPVFLPFTPIVAALIAGNTVVHKPSEFVPQITEAVARVVYEAGVPRDVYQVVHGYGDTGAALIEARPDVISFTGSDHTGRKIAAKAGELLIPVTLELGGKDAAIVLEDADIDRTARNLVWAGTLNAGQACVSIERIYVMRPVAEKLLQTMKTIIEKHVRPGLPNDPNATYGPITTDPQFRIVESQVKEAIEKKARVIQGKFDAQGRCYAPTLITDVPEDAGIVTDETFGPVMVLIPIDSDEEAIQKANGARFGLTASIWTGDKKRGLKMARRMEVGVVSLNDHIWSSSVPEMPWGGVKDSGYGKTRGREGLLDMTVPVAMSYPRFPLPLEPFCIPYTRWKKAFVRRLIHFRYGATWQDKLKAFKLRS